MIGGLSDVHPPDPVSDPLVRTFTAAAVYLKQALLGDSPAAEACRRYLVARGIPQVLFPRLPIGALDNPIHFRQAIAAQGIAANVLVQTGLFASYVAQHPLIFIYTDATGITGFKCRLPDLTRKDVLNAKGFGGEREARSLFCLDLARAAMAATGTAIVVEGEFDALAWHAAALERGQTIEFVALGGTAKPTLEKFQTLRGLGARLVYLALDADPPGQAATAAACPLAWQAGLEVFVLPMPEGMKDPDEVLQRLGLPAAHAAFFTHDRARPGALWLAEWLLGQHASVIPDVTARFRQAASDAASAMPPTPRAAFRSALAGPLGVSAAALGKEWAAAARQRHEAALRQELGAWARQLPILLTQGNLSVRLAEAERTLASIRTRFEAADSRQGQDVESIVKKLRKRLLTRGEQNPHRRDTWPETKIAKLAEIKRPNKGQERLSRPGPPMNYSLGTK